MASLLKASYKAYYHQQKKLSDGIPIKWRNTLFFSGLARFDYVSGGRRAFDLSLLESLNIHRTSWESRWIYKKFMLGDLQPTNAEELAICLASEIRFNHSEPKTDVGILC